MRSPPDFVHARRGRAFRRPRPDRLPPAARRGDARRSQPSGRTGKSIVFVTGGWAYAPDRRWHAAGMAGPDMTGGTGPDRKVRRGSRRRDRRPGVAAPRRERRRGSRCSGTSARRCRSARRPPVPHRPDDSGVRAASVTPRQERAGQSADPRAASTRRPACACAPVPVPVRRRKSPVPTWRSARSSARRRP